MNTTRLQALLKFHEQDPNDSFTQYAIAMEYVSMNNLETAMKYLEHLITIDALYVPAYHQLGILFSHSGDIEKGKAIFRQGIQIAERIGDSHAMKEMQESLDDLGEEL